MSEARAYNPEDLDPQTLQEKIEDSSWQALGACRDVDPKVFFPRDGIGTTVAQRICNMCVVQEHCLEYALETRQDNGVWGGTSERERRRILKRRRLTS